MDLDIINFGPVLIDVTKSIEFLRGRNLLLNDYFCCGSMCSKVMDSSLNDKQIFQCNHCRRRYSIQT